MRLPQLSSRFSQYLLRVICASLVLPIYHVNSQKLTRTEIAFDACREGRFYNNSVPCNPNIGPLTGISLGMDFGQQCRSLCRDFNNPDFNFFHMPSECNYCNSNRMEEFEMRIGHGGTVYVHICAPRGVCIDLCGQEPPGCVYSGTCGSFICAESRSGKPAKRRRVTHAGPRSIFEVDGKKTATVETANRPGTLSVKSGCQESEQPVWFPISDKECPARSGGKPLSDPRQNGSSDQCRAYCGKFSSGEYEVLHKGGACSFCSTAESLQYMVLNDSTEHICIPRKKCIEKCGEEPPGCVYSGTCREVFCFSGINSKRPAVIISDDSGDPSSISVNNKGPAITIDPPLYASLSNVEPDPDANASEPKGSPEETVDPEQSSDSKTQNDDDDRSARHWEWLGPVLGLVGAALVSAGGIYGAYILRGGGDRPEMDIGADMLDNIN